MNEEELRERSIELGLRLATVADRLMCTAQELQALADHIRTCRRMDDDDHATE